MGRMILAHLPRERVQSLFADYSFPAITAQTPTTLDNLLAQVDRDREAGLAWSVAFFEEGIGSCSAPVLDQTGHAAAAISLSGPQAAFEEGSGKRGLIAESLRECAGRLSKLMGHHG